MTEALVSKTCTPCRGGIPPLTREQAALFHAQAPDWQLPEEAHRIERSFRFRNFREALTFVQEIGELAEAEGHHPNISFGWGNATVSLQTKKIKGLHENDFIMATKIDRIFAGTSGVKQCSCTATCTRACLCCEQSSVIHHVPW
jgi:4a-hydroxytetrahydrobiopterin dehydratase